MKALIIVTLSALLTAVLTVGPAFAQAVEVVLVEDPPAETTAPDAVAAEEAAPAAPQPQGRETAAPGAVDEGLPVITITKTIDQSAADWSQPWDGLYTPGELAAIRIRDLSSTPWDYGMNLNYLNGPPIPEKTWVHKWGLAGVDLVPFFTDGAAYAAKKAGIVSVVDQVTDEAGDWVADETGMDFWSSENQEKLERKFGFLGALLNFF